MGITTMTAASLSESIGETVTDIHVLIAKNSVAGMDPHGIAELLGVSVQEIQEIQQEQVYKDARLLLANEYATSKIDSDFNWDEIENQALKGLAKRVPFEKDTETLLRIASVANKAQRRTSQQAAQVLDPSAGGARVPLTLTRRIVTRLNDKGAAKEVEETQQISVLDGSAKNPKFEDIDALLGVSRRPAIPDKMMIKTHEADFTLDDLEFKQ